MEDLVWRMCSLSILAAGPFGVHVKYVVFLRKFEESVLVKYFDGVEYVVHNLATFNKNRIKIWMFAKS